MITTNTQSLKPLFNNNQSYCKETSSQVINSKRQKKQLENIWRIKIVTIILNKNGL